MRDVDEVSGIVVDSAYRLHRGLGPGLLESVYATILTRVLEKRGLEVERERAVAFEYEGISFDDGLRVDLLVDRRVVVEVKSIETLAPVHAKQLITYLRLMDLHVGLLLNFGAPWMKDGVRRVVNRHTPSPQTPIRVDRLMP